MIIDKANKFLDTVFICAAIGFLIGIMIAVIHQSEEFAKDPKYKDPSYCIGILTNSYEVFEGIRDK